MNDINQIEEYINHKLIFISMLVERTEVLIENDIADTKISLEEIKKEYKPDFVKSIFDSGYRTPFDFKKLQEEKPEIALEFSKQLRLSHKVNWKETQIVVAESNYQQLVVSSLFLFVVSHLETGLRLICDYIKNKNGLELSWADLKGSSLDVYKKYLSKVAHVSYCFDKSISWPCMKEYYIIRNFVIHRGCLLDDSDISKKVIELVKKYTNLSIRNNLELIINKDFIDEVIDQSDKFFNDLLILVKGI
ncbi:MAG: hypothetical protein KF816_17185 [Melioribacteraceae bacterium]|nr:hypothetical protein [Melioribacteraceae bacterium]